MLKKEEGWKWKQQNLIFCKTKSLKLLTPETFCLRFM